MGLNDVNIDQVVNDINSRSQGNSANAQEQNTQQSSTSGAPELSDKASSSNEEMLNLNSVLKFKFGDREWTPDQLEKAILRQSDYTKKTQQLAESRKYYDNLEADLENVRGNPELVDKFMEVYPKEFHKYLKLANNQQEAISRQAQAQNENAPIDPQLLSKLERLESHIRNTEIKAKEAELDAKFSSLAKKYPDANEEVVLARAQALIDRGGLVNDQVWDKLWKQSHDSFLSRFEAKQKQTLQQQRMANSKAAGPSSAGGVPTNAPRRETFAQATDRAIQELQGRKF